MIKRISTLVFVAIPMAVFSQLSITSTGTTTIDFDNTLSGVNNGAYTSDGFASSPSSGQINSNAIVVLGLSPGDLAFGDNKSSGDYARGTSTGGENVGGMYAFNTSSGGTDYCLGIQPTNSDFTPGAIVLKVTNNSSDGVYFSISYDIKEYNDQASSMSVNFSHSADNSTYTDESSLDFTSTATAAGSPAWTTTNKSINMAIAVPTSGDYYFKWSFDDASGTGSRDELGIDNIQITTTQISVGSTIANNGNESATISSLINSSSITSTSDGVKVWELQLNDGDGSTNDGDALPTIYRKLKVTKGGSNQVASWSSVIQSAAIFNGSTRLDVADVYADSLVFNLSTSEGTVADNGNKVLDIYLSLETSVTDLEHFQFQIEKDNITVEDLSSSSQLSGFSSFTSNISNNEVSVVPTALSFVEQPRSSYVNFNMSPSVEVAFTDANGNNDLDGNGSAQLRLTSSGTLSSTPITATINSSGIASFSSVNHTATGSSLQLTITDFNDFLSAGSNTAITSNTFDITQLDSLFITEVADPSDNGNAKFIEIFNGGSSAIDFSSTTYYLGIQFNAGTINNLQLTGSIPAKGVYTIASSESNFTSAYSLTADRGYSFLGNGNDVVILYKGGNSSSGTVADIYGVLDVDGTGESWEYTDGRAIRNTSVVSGRPEWNSSDWTVTTSVNVSSMTPKRLESELRHYSNDNWVGGTPSSSTGSSDLVVQSGTATTTGNIVGNSITVLSDGIMTISSSHALDVTDEIVVYSGGSLTVENSGSLLQTNASAANAGNITFKRTGITSDLKYNIWSSPVQDAGITTVFSGTNPCDIYTFDADVQLWKYDFTPNVGSYNCNGNTGVQFSNSHVLTTGTADGVMDVGRGYYIPGHASNNTFQFTGTPFNGSYTIPVYAATNPGSVPWSDDNWNLLGNPYPCAINLSHSNNNSFQSVNSSLITGDYYFWIDDGDTANYDENADFAVFNNGGGTTANGTTANQYVPAGRGFWVKVISDGNVSFNNNMKISGNNAAWYKTNNNGLTQQASLTLHQGNLNKNILISLHPNATDGYDMGWDAPTLSNGGKLGFASICDSGDFAIQTIAPPLEHFPKCVPLHIQTQIDGYHRLALDARSTLDQYIGIELIDTLKHESYDLLAGEAKLQLDSGDYADRFYVLFYQMPEKQDSTVNVNSVEKENVKLIVWENQVQLIGESLQDFDELEVFDLIGRRVHQQKVTSNWEQFAIPSSWKNGSYFIRLTGKKEKQLRFQLTR